VYDEMMNLVLTSAKERDPESKQIIRSVGTLFIRGNNVLLVTLEE
jgi:small nuclear ribonucleoprotein (snRNP)-like protein